MQNFSNRQDAAGDAELQGWQGDFGGPTLCEPRHPQGKERSESPGPQAVTACSRLKEKVGSCSHPLTVYKMGHIRGFIVY